MIVNLLPEICTGKFLGSVMLSCTSFFWIFVCILFGRHKLLLLLDVRLRNSCG